MNIKKRYQNLNKNFIKKYESYKKFARKNKNKKKISLVFGALVFGALFYFAKGLFIAALVNGSPVSRLSVVSELENQGGKQVLDTLITKSIILQEAKKAKVFVSESEIDDEIQKTKKLVEEQGLTLENALSLQGTTMDTLKENIRIKKTIEKLLSDEISIGDDDIKNYFDENKQYYGENTSFEDVEDAVKEQLYQQKLSSKYNDWITNLKQNANIKYFVEY